MLKSLCSSTAIPAALLAVFLFLSVGYKQPDLGARRVKLDGPEPGEERRPKKNKEKPVAVPVKEALGTGTVDVDRDLVVAGTAGGHGSSEVDGEEIDPADPEEELEEEEDGSMAAMDDAEDDMESTASAGDGGADSMQQNVQRVSRSCFVYDRPPRTGSTTVARALKACMSKRGYRQPRAESRWVRTELVGRMLGLSGGKVGLLSNHMYMSAGDVERMKRECGKLLYVSSCKRMRERLWSAAKYRFSEGIGNFSLKEEMKVEAVGMVWRDRRTEMFLEGYPYLGVDEKKIEVAEEGKLVPDYVVRAERMEEDLGRLLEALKCEGTFQSRNVHEADEESRDFLKKLPLRMGDAAFRRLNSMAEETNEKGLRKAEAFR